MLEHREKAGRAGQPKSSRSRGFSGRRDERQGDRMEATETRIVGSRRRDGTLYAPFSEMVQKKAVGRPVFPVSALARSGMLVSPFDRPAVVS